MREGTSDAAPSPDARGRGTIEICCRLRTGKNGPAIKFRETEKWILCNFRKEFRHEFREIWVHAMKWGRACLPVPRPSEVLTRM